MSSDPVVVELFGQPGSGKSAIARAVVTGSEMRTRAELGADWKQQSVVLKALIFGRTFLHGSCLVEAIKFATRAQLFHLDSLSRLFRLVIKSHWVRSQTGRWLLDEGHLQELWSIYYSADRTEPDPRLLAPLIARLYRGLDVQIVFLDSDAETIFDRIRGRANGKSRLDRLAEAELRQHLVATAQLPHRIVDAARMAGLTVDRVDAGNPIDATLGHVRAAMQSL